MVAKRIVACLDVRHGRVVKGVQFASLRDMGDPAELAVRYANSGADEITFLDVTATLEGRRALRDTVERTAENLFVPLTVGGGVRSVADARALLNAGADKVAVNTAALENPRLLTELANEYGTQCVVVAIDAKRDGEGWHVRTHGGRRSTSKGAIAWAAEAVRAGAGEILLTSVDADGRRAGYDLDLTRRTVEAVSVPVVASGGCGSNDDAYRALVDAGADAALVASLFHTRQETPASMKRALGQRGVEVRP